MNDLIDTTEMYLRTVLELEEEGVVPLRARIAERLRQSGPTVSQTVARMERDGLLTVEGDRHLELTDEGRSRATAVMRKHRLAECLLVQVIGLEYDQAHVEACRWEHVMSDEVERKVYALLGGPQVSPYGNPIPGLAELTGPAGPAVAHTPDTAVPVSLDTVQTGDVVVRRLSELLQNDVDVVQRLHAAGVRPGAAVAVRRDGAGYVLNADGADVGVTAQVAGLVFVTAS